MVNIGKLKYTIQHHECRPVGFLLFGHTLFSKFILCHAEGLFLGHAAEVMTIETCHQLLGGTVGHLPQTHDDGPCTSLLETALQTEYTLA